MDRTCTVTTKEETKYIVRAVNIMKGRHLKRIKCQKH